MGLKNYISLRLMIRKSGNVWMVALRNPRLGWTASSFRNFSRKNFVEMRLASRENIIASLASLTSLARAMYFYFCDILAGLANKKNHNL
jgi:hypothetical protein